MNDAFLLGLISQSSLLLSGLAVYWIHVPKKVIGFIAGFGAGALISAVAFDLIAQDKVKALGQFEGGIWLLIGAFIYIAGDYIVDKRFSSEGSSEALGIILGAVVDGIPESFILGIQLAVGIAISPAFLFAVWVSNIPQALAPSADLAGS